MFEGMKGMAGLAGIMKDLPRMRERMDEIRAQLEKVEVTAETGGGAVSATANGKMRITRITIDPAMLSVLVDAERPEDKEIAEELIAGAVNAALEKAKEAAAEEFAEAARQFNIPIPPGGLQGML